MPSFEDVPATTATCQSGIHLDGNRCILSEETIHQNNLDPVALKTVWKAVLRAVHEWASSQSKKDPMMPSRIRVSCDGTVEEIMWTSFSLRFFNSPRIVDAVTGTFAWMLYMVWLNTEYQITGFGHPVGFDGLNHREQHVICRKSLIAAFRTFQSTTICTEDMLNLIDNLSVEWFLIDRGHGEKDFGGNCRNMTDPYIIARLPEGYESDCIEPEMPTSTPMKYGKKKSSTRKVVKANVRKDSQPPMRARKRQHQRTSHK